VDEKLQKVLARAGFGSRRTMESWISAGRVKVNGIIASLGDRVSASKGVKVSRENIFIQEKSRDQEARDKRQATTLSGFNGFL
jgi:23S rRNA pseudouridine2605 synthase